jgi:chlorobactene glucosyltransferase
MSTGHDESCLNGGEQLHNLAAARWYHRLVLGTLSLLSLNLVSNLLALKRLAAIPEGNPAPPDAPLVSVLVPARDEERTIGACVNALLAQTYPRYEVLVLDDESRDRTAAIVAELAAAHPHLRLLHGAPLLPGWMGKSFACWQLAQAARGDYLLFTDADTVLAPHTVAKALALAQQHNLDLVTAIPYHRAITWGERLILPLIAFHTLTLLPVPLANRLPIPSLSAGMGPFLFLRRTAYLASGGHAAVRDQVLEDVHLARRVKATGARVWLIDGTGAVTTHMYHSFREIWQGFSKNLFAFYNYSLPAALLAISVNILLYVVPPALLMIHHRRAPDCKHVLLRKRSRLSALVGKKHQVAYIPLRGDGHRHGLAPRSGLPLAIVETALGLGMRLALAARLRTSIASALLHPLGILLQSAITLNSIRWSQRAVGGVQGARGQIAWKGRTYTLIANGVAQIAGTSAPSVYRPE